MPQPWSPGPLLPVWAQDPLQQPRKEMRKHTSSQLLCSHPAGSKVSFTTSLSHAAHQTSDGRGTCLCAVPLAENEGFLPLGTPQGKSDGSMHPNSLFLRSAVRGGHGTWEALQQHQSGTTGQNYFPLGRARTISRFEPIPKPLTIDKLQTIGTPLVHSMLRAEQGKLRRLMASPTNPRQ